MTQKSLSGKLARSLVWEEMRWLQKKVSCAFSANILTKDCAGLKTRAVKERMNFIVGVNGHLKEWSRLNTIAEYAINAMRKTL